MIVREVINLLLGAAIVTERVEDRIYPEEFPNAPTYPAIIVLKSSGHPDYDLRGATGVENDRVQIDMYSDKGYDDCLMLKEAVKSYLSGYKDSGLVTGAPCIIQGAFVIMDSDLPVEKTDRAGPRLRRRMLEFRIWSN